MCGEKYFIFFIDFVFVGITPACAGKRERAVGCLRLLQDHPRVCGEKHFGGIIRVCIVGSPPRVRGKGFRNLVEVRLIRITPAYAGKRRSASCLTCPPRDHPRVCGEKYNDGMNQKPGVGSPPRMRGKDAARKIPISIGGITPAYAGKSWVHSCFHFYARDHPRVCGEKYNDGMNQKPGVGSPPRMRGKDAARKIPISIGGITPAYAGKSWVHSCFHFYARDHPRVCGEKYMFPVLLALFVGSPPRMRGKGYHGLSGNHPRGITPAYAGKRLKRSHSISHFSCILCLFHSVLHRASVSGGSRAGPCAPPCLPAQNTVPV